MTSSAPLSFDSGSWRGRGTHLFGPAFHTIVVAVLLVLPLVMTPFQNFRLSTVFFYAVVALGLNLLTGYTGQISLGHSAFFAAGAYAAAVLMTDHGWAYLATLPVIAVASYVAGYAFGLPALRLRGLYLAMVTLGLALVTPILIRTLPFTGGGSGVILPYVEAPAWTGLAVDQWIYFVCLGLTLLGFLVARNLVVSHTGLAMRAVRDNEIAASVAGIDVARVKKRVFATSAAYAGVAGAMYALVIQFVGPDAFGLLLSVGFLTAIVVGGLSTLWGAVFGALFLVFAPAVTNDIDPSLSGLLYGGLLVIVMLVAPSGVVGILRKIQRLLNPRRPSLEPSSEAAPPATSTNASNSEDRVVANAKEVPL